MNKIKSLSDKIEDTDKTLIYYGEYIPVNEVRQFIADLKKEINDNGAKNVVKDIRGNCSAGYGIEYRILFRIINNLVGEKLIWGLNVNL